MSKKPGLAVSIIAIVLMLLSLFIAANITITEETDLLNQTVSVDGLKWKNINFWSRSGKLMGQITSDKPINAYLNYQGNVYEWRAEGVTQAILHPTDTGIGPQTLNIYNPNWFSATVHVRITERITSHPYSSFCQGLFVFSLLILLPVGLVLIFLSMRKRKSNPKGWSLNGGI